MEYPDSLIDTIRCTLNRDYYRKMLSGLHEELLRRGLDLAHDPIGQDSHDLSTQDRLALETAILSARVHHLYPDASDAQWERWIRTGVSDGAGRSWLDGFLAGIKEAGYAIVKPRMKLEITDENAKEIADLLFEGLPIG
ncbi:hypothetical protein [Stenotrophomonas maltophilia]|uniref:hypothetical protein n=1 Tax=Stenotrophomonas maltophilia TaxID=40324 RepID=UPI00066D0EB8|nr:hypothetical protein [Stenotrophomonas maltophilia]MDH0793347.1 hypothetical protein [Stenotrophomonas maltophilia]